MIFRRPDPPPHDPGLSYLHITEVRDAEFYVGPLFRRKFGHPPPDYPRHFIAFYRHGAHHFAPLGYMHVLPAGRIALIGGACTDGQVFKLMTEQQARGIKDAGGVMYNLLRHVFTHLTEYEGFFGNVGNPRAEAVDLQAGFRHTGVPRLIAYFPRPITPWRKKRLIRRVAAMGTF